MITAKEKGKKGKNCHTSKEKLKTAEANYQRTSKAEIKRKREREREREREKERKKEREEKRGVPRTKLSKIHDENKTSKH